MDRALLLEDGTLKHFEFKNIERLLRGTEISQLHSMVTAAAKNARAAFSLKRQRLDALKRAFASTVYKFPKTAEPLRAQIEEQLAREVASVLPRWAKSAASEIAKDLLFEGSLR